MAKISKSGSAIVKSGDGRVAQLLVYLINSMQNISIDTGDITVNTQDIENLLQGIGGSVETPGYSRVSDSSSLATGFFSIAVANVGGADGTLLGTTLPAGDTVRLCAKTGNTLGAVAYNATGTTFAIVTTKIV